MRNSNASRQVPPPASKPCSTPAMSRLIPVAQPSGDLQRRNRRTEADLPRVTQLMAGPRFVPSCTTYQTASPRVPISISPVTETDSVKTVAALSRLGIQSSLLTALGPHDFAQLSLYLIDRRSEQKGSKKSATHSEAKDKYELEASDT